MHMCTIYTICMHVRVCVWGCVCVCMFMIYISCWVDLGLVAVDAYCPLRRRATGNRARPYVTLSIRFLRYPRLFWLILTHSDSFWLILTHYDSLWLISDLYMTSLFLLGSYAIPDPMPLPDAAYQDNWIGKQAVALLKRKPAGTFIRVLAWSHSPFISFSRTLILPFSFI